MRLLEHVLQLRLLGLQVRVSANVLLGDEDIGDGALAGHFFEGVLDRGTVVYVVVGLLVCCVL